MFDVVMTPLCHGAPAAQAVALLASFLIADDPEPDQTAAALIAEFGTLGAVISGAQSRILRASGGNAKALAVVRAVKATVQHLLLERVERCVLLSNHAALLDYLQLTMQHATREQVRVLHLSSSNNLIKDEVLSEGTIDQAPIYVRELIGRCIELGSAAIILVHNHPSGNPAPSRADIAITQSIVDACKLMSIKVHDHIIIGSGGHVSLRSKGLM